MNIKKIMLNHSFKIIMLGLLSMIIASIVFYYDTRSSIAYVSFVIGFVLVGVGILLGFIKMVSSDK